MKNLDVKYNFQGNIKIMPFEVPNGKSQSDVQTAINNQLSSLSGTPSANCSLEQVMSGSSDLNYNASLLNTTTVAQIKNAITSGVTIIGGRSRRG